MAPYSGRLRPSTMGAGDLVGAPLDFREDETNETTYCRCVMHPFSRKHGRERATAPKLHRPATWKLESAFLHPRGPGDRPKDQPAGCAPQWFLKLRVRLPDVRHFNKGWTKSTSHPCTDRCGANRSLQRGHRLCRNL